MFNRNSFTITDLRVDDSNYESCVTPIGIGDRDPRFSWRVKSERNGARQTAYRIKIFNCSNCIYDTDIIESVKSHGIRLGISLQPRTQYSWRVSVRDDLNEWYDSDVLHFATGFFSLEDWPTQFVTCKGANGNSEHPEPVHNNNFSKFEY